MSFLEFLPQCCDAQDYLYYGQNCANGNCFEPLRPIGALYWFSLPYRLNLPPEILILFHWVLLIASVALFTLAATSLIEKSGKPLSRYSQAVLVLVTLAIHIFFFRPVLYHALTDAPAGLFLLIGIWLFILGCLKNGWMSYLVAGLCLGLSVWLRSFYLYPVLMFVFISLLIAIISRKNHFRKIALFIALLPIAYQYYSVHQHLGYYAYLSETESSLWTEHHLSSRYSGHDSDLSEKKAYAWASACGSEAHGFLQAWQEKNIRGMICLVKERMYFYWGSYLPTSYLVPPEDFVVPLNPLTHHERLDNLWVWWKNNLSVEANVAADPNGKQQAEKLLVQQSDANGRAAAIYQTAGYIPLKKKIPHTFSVWLWSPKPLTITLAVFSNQDNSLAGNRNITLTDTPVRYELVFTPSQDALHYVGIGSFDGIAVDFGKSADDFIYAWGLQLTESPHMLVYEPDLKLNEQRIWSPILLVLNTFAVLVTFGLLLVGLKALPLFNRTILLLFFGGVFGLSLLIIPEQRFLVAFMVFCWQILLLGIFLFLSQKSVEAHA